MPTNLDFKCALVTGGAGGIGLALARYFLSKGKKVIICGRTEEKLRTALSGPLKACAGYYVLDTGNTAKIPAFIAKVTKDHPDLDCLVNNAGIQQPLRLLQDDPTTLLAKADEEIAINVTGPMHLAVGLLEHFQTQSSATIINVSSVLGFIPLEIINPVYNGTKAWLHAWTMSLRVQLRDSGIKVVEIVPPLVETDLHRGRIDPDDNKKHKNATALTMEEFMEEITEKLERGETTITAGLGNAVVAKWFESYEDRLAKAASSWQ
ncbi:putative secondary metabolism biosynthetic enzyme [Gnomoniopsis sp. IMI 355080]|nr:putative secondary metabolism biosynthetic enzyme [Gnomoniopsis sp. IMI 355080]